MSGQQGLGERLELGRISQARDEPAPTDAGLHPMACEGAEAVPESLPRGHRFEHRADGRAGDRAVGRARREHLGESKTGGPPAAGST